MFSQHNQAGSAKTQQSSRQEMSRGFEQAASVTECRCSIDWSQELSDPQHMVWTALAKGKNDFLPAARKAMKAYKTAGPAAAEAAAKDAMSAFMMLRIVSVFRPHPHKRRAQSRANQCFPFKRTHCYYEIAVPCTCLSGTHHLCLSVFTSQLATHARVEVEVSATWLESYPNQSCIM